MLAGGEGVRLRPLVRELCSDERPKQIAKIVGSKSLLSHTLGRVALKIRPERTAIFTCRAHGKYMEQEFRDTEAAYSCAARRSWYGRRHVFPGSLDQFAGS